MKTIGINIQVFFDILKAGIWEYDVHPSKHDTIDFSKIYKLASEQAVVGVVTAGLEHIVDIDTPKDFVLAMVGETLQLEQRNRAMNEFIEELIAAFKKFDIHALLVKGQGIAQCYERPLWRTCGDVDLFLDKENYYKAKEYLGEIAQHVEEEYKDRLHMGFTINSWIVELHGTLRSDLGTRIDNGMDSLQAVTFGKNRYRMWKNGQLEVCLPAPDEDILYVFVHILQHFFQGGIGLRQLCDWCRLLWTYQNEIDVDLLNRRLLEMGLVREWKAFAALAVEYLGMPIEAMPLYSSDKSWKSKADRIISMIMETGNFGHNKVGITQKKHSVFVKKTRTFFISSWYSLRQLFMFPQETIVAWSIMVKMGVRDVVRKR